MTQTRPQLLTGAKAADRYGRAFEHALSIAKDESEKAMLEEMKILDNLVECDENGTALSLFQVKVTPTEFMPRYVNKEFSLSLSKSKTKTTGRRKHLKFAFGRPPAQTHLADCMRATNFMFKLLESITVEEFDSIDVEDVKKIFEKAGKRDARHRLITLDQYGGQNKWRTLRKRYRTPELNPELIRRQGEEILAKQQPTQYDDSNLISTVSQSLSELVKSCETNNAEIAQATRRFYFETGSEEDEKRMEATLNDYMNRFLGGPQRYVHLEHDLNSPYLQRSFNRDTDVVIIQDGRSINELNATSIAALYRLRVIIPYVNLPTYMVHKYLDNLISTGNNWNCIADAQTIIGFLPQDCTIHRMKYGENNTLELNRTYRVNEITAECNAERGTELGFIYSYYLAARRSS